MRFYVCIDKAGSVDQFEGQVSLFTSRKAAKAWIADVDNPRANLIAEVTVAFKDKELATLPIQTVTIPPPPNGCYD